MTTYRKRKKCASPSFYSFHLGGTDKICILRKFVAEFGEDAFFAYYLPHLRLLGVDHLPGVAQQYRRDVAAANRPDTPRTTRKRKGGGGKADTPKVPSKKKA